MTILVGLLCENGVVIGADSSALLGVHPQLPTIEQRVKKIHIISESVIIAGTGQVGLGQRFRDATQKFFEEGGFKKDRDVRAMEIAKRLCARTIEDFQSTCVAPNQFGALLAFPLGKTPHLFELAQADFQPEEKNRNSLWYVSMGSGQPIVDPFLGLIRRAFWEDEKGKLRDEKLPTLSEGTFVVTWALDHVIDLNPGGINGPAQIATLEEDPDTGQPKARLLEEDDLEEHRESVRSALQHLGDYRKRFHGEKAQQIPQPES